MGLAIAGQPEPHYYFHRPISALFGACFDAGFTLDGIAEPTFRSPETADEGRANPMWWANHTAIPPALIAPHATHCALEGVFKVHHDGAKRRSMR